MHPAVGKEIARRIDLQRDSDRVVVLDVPLLVETGRRGMAGVVVVDAPLDVAVDRLVRHRGMSEADALARMSRQASREERRAQADWVVDNAGPRATWSTRSTELWAWLQTLPPADPPEAPADSRRRTRRPTRRPRWPAPAGLACRSPVGGCRELLTPAGLPLDAASRFRSDRPSAHIRAMGSRRSPTSDRWVRAMELAERQHAAVTRRQLEQLGIDRRMVRARGSPPASSPSPGRVCSSSQELRPRSSRG